MIFEEKNKKIKVVNILSFLLFIFLVSVTRTDAASLKITPASGTYRVGETITARLLVSSSDQAINAVSGTVNYSKDLLTLSSVSKSSSLVSLWAQEPKFSNSSGVLTFEGVLLSGYTGTSGTILTLTFTVQGEGTASIKYSSDSTVLANDGQGTNVLTSVTGALFTTKAGATVPVSTTPSTGIEVVVLPKDDPSDVRTDLTIFAKNKKLGEPYIITIDDGEPITWMDGGLHSYQTLPLLAGAHTVVVETKDTHGNLLTGSASFTIATVLKPQITDYQTNNTDGQFLVVKGKADPFVTVTVYVSNLTNDAGFTTTDEMAGLKTTATTVLTNSSGKFVFVSNTKIPAGIYILTAQSKTQSGNQSELSDPVKFVVASVAATPWWLMNKIVIPVVGLLFIILLIIILLLRRKLVREKRMRAGERTTSLTTPPSNTSSTPPPTA